MGQLIEIKDINDYEVFTDTGWNDIKNVSKTIPYQIYELRTNNFKLRCADKHIVFTEDMKEIYVKDLIIGQKIQTQNGLESVLEIIIHEQFENMYDLQLEEGNRRFYTNGILSHNTLAKCHFAAAAIKQGFNVLYFTMEMAQERIAQRIDANLLDLDHNEIPFLSEEDYKKQMKAVKQFCRGKLIIKEFPTGSATSNHFKHIIEELKRKKNTKVDLMIVDYLNICSSSRYKATNGVNTYTILKCVAEEIRSLGMEYDMAVLSSAQVNRGNLNNLDMGLDGVSESMGITHTADLVWYLFRNDQLDALNRILVTQLKNRYDDLTKMKRFLVGVFRGKMKLFGVDSNETAVFLGSTDSSGEEQVAAPEVNADHFKGRSQTSSKSFSDFKF